MLFISLQYSLGWFTIKMLHRGELHSLFNVKSEP